MSGAKQPRAKKGHPKMFTKTPKELERLTPWQRLEHIAFKVFSTKKSDIDAHKPVRPRKTKSA